MELGNAVARLMFGLLLIWISACAAADVLPATSYERHEFTDPSFHPAVQASGELSGNGAGVTGWVQYRADVTQTGWYELRVHGNPPSGVEFLIDPDAAGTAPLERRVLPGAMIMEPAPLAGNIWLTAGTHRIRLVRYYWTGFPKISAIELRRAPRQLGDALRVLMAADTRVFRRKQCARLIAQGGGDGIQGNVQILDTEVGTQRILQRIDLRIATSAQPSSQEFPLRCDIAGQHRIIVLVNGKTIAAPSLDFQVVDTTPPPSSTATKDRPASYEIDCVRQQPDYASSSGTRLTDSEGQTYRESADTGWIAWQRRNVQQRNLHPEPDWFAYTLQGILPQRRYRVEVDYPDDTARTFAVAWREVSPLQYPVATAVETGGEHPLSKKTQTLTFHVWARAAAPRLTFQPAHDGVRAACQRIRIYLADEQIAALPEPPYPSRPFVNWYEEGENFTSLYGPANPSEAGFGEAAERWMQAAIESGTDLLMPTVSIYNFAMYPSAFNLAFSRPERDTLQMLMLQAERYGLRIVPELHPRADELAFSDNGASRQGKFLLSREGRDNRLDTAGRRNMPPYYNALNPDVAQWYTGMVRELATRYADSPAFEGISLRYMGWANAALNNLVSLDWGYDDDTIARYRADTGSRLPLGRSTDPQRFSRYHEWLTTNERDAWTDWRCREIVKLFTRLRDQLRSVRPDLHLYLHIYGPTIAAKPNGDEEFRTKLREAGLDLSLLADIDGLTLINSSLTYGRLEPDGVFFIGTRDAVIDAKLIGAPPSGPPGQWFVPTSNYLEAIGAVLPPSQLGFDSSTPATWMSAASNPPGRLALERHALLLAQTDALALGDGGNNLTLGVSPAVADFAREYRKLPSQPFNAIANATDPVTVRELTESQRYWFYAVNRENYPVDVRIDLTDIEHTPQGQVLRFTLPAYGLRVFQADPTARIRSVHAPAPETQIQRITERIDWAARLLSGNVGIAPPTGGDARLLATTIEIARDALAQGRPWQARTAFETSAVLRLFRRSGCYPPDMGFAETNPPNCRRSSQ